MTRRIETYALRGFVAASIVAFAFFGYGCSNSNNSPTLVGQFTTSTTAPALHLVKLVPGSASGARVVVQAVIYGPDTSLDMFAFAFDVKISDPTVLAYVANSAMAGDALVATAGQTISVIAGPDGSDPTHIVVGVSKLGGPPGNGVANASAVIVTMAFDVLKEGTSSLGIAATPTPSLLDSAQPPQPIAGITFDAATGTVTGVSTGGGGY